MTHVRGVVSNFSRSSRGVETCVVDKITLLFHNLLIRVGLGNMSEGSLQKITGFDWFLSEVLASFPTGFRGVLGFQVGRFVR